MSRRQLDSIRCFAFAACWITSIAWGESVEQAPLLEPSLPVSGSGEGARVSIEMAPAPAADEPAVNTNPDESRPREFIQIEGSDTKPSVRTILPFDESNVFFLNHSGQIGAAKFTPGLGLIGWELYSDVKMDCLPSLALGPNFSLSLALPYEILQAFDTDQDAELDTFQALVREWTGREDGVTITAGPVADAHGRLLFALSPHATAEGEAPKARLMAWRPEAEKLVCLTESQLPIESFVVGQDGLLAARLSLPGYKDGYYLSLTDLPPFLPETPDEEPSPMPHTAPSLLVPAELTKSQVPNQLSFCQEDGRRKLLLTCPGASQILEIVPEKKDQVWQGAVLLREILPSPVDSIGEMKPGLLLGGGAGGFVPLGKNDGIYRISSVEVYPDGIALQFTQPVDRVAAANADNYSLRAVPLQGEPVQLTCIPLIESDGKGVVLKIENLPTSAVLRIACQNLPSETGESLLTNTAFYGLHRR